MNHLYSIFSQICRRTTVFDGSRPYGLGLPLRIKRPAVYTVRWNVTAGTKRATRVTRVTLTR